MSKKTAGTNNFLCVSCGMEMDCDTAANQAKCRHCGAVESVCSNGDSEDIDFNALESDSSLYDWGFPVKKINCSNCGTKLIVQAETKMLSCPFCSSSQIIAADEIPGMYPDSVVQFKVSVNDAGARFIRWIHHLKMAPFSMKKAYEVGTMCGVYIPYWSFETKSKSAYTGQAGSFYRESDQDTHTEDGKTEARPKNTKKTRWRFVSGSYEKAFSGILYNDSTLSEDTIRHIEPFKLNELTKFTAKHLNSSSVLQYDAGLKSVWVRAKSYMGKVIRQDIHGIVKKGSDVTGATRIFTNYHDVRYTQLLMPLWASSYQYKNKKYPFFINGQTGEVTGESPKSALKILMILLVGLGALAAAYFLFLNK